MNVYKKSYEFFIWRISSQDQITEVEYFTKKMDGGSFAKFVSDFLADRYFSSISISDQKIFVSCFDPMDGTGQDVLIKYKAIKGAK